MKLQRVFLQLCLSLVACLFGVSATARAEYFEIEHCSVIIHVTETAELQIEETIDVRFTSSRHGIFRTIPYKYRTNTLVGTYSTSIYDIEVPGEKWRTENKDSKLLIRIGDPNDYVNGTHRYTIRYKVFGAIQFHEGFSELYWNAIGLEWDVPIHRAFIQVIAPKGVSLQAGDYFAYTGPFGSTRRDAGVVWEGQQLTVSTTRSLSPKEGVTIGLKFPEGFLHNGDLSLRWRLFMANYAITLVPVITFMTLYLVWRTVGRDEPITQMVFYHPPKELTSAEAGVIEDDTTDNRDLSSLIIGWASQGYISIREKDRGTAFGGKDLEFTRKGSLPAGSRSYELVLFNELFATGDTVLVSSLKDRFYATMFSARKDLEREIDRMALYERGSRGLGATISALAPFVVFGLYFVLSGEQGFGVVHIGSILLTGAILFFFGRIMPKKTSKGRLLYQHVAGFREFMQRVEAPQLERLLKDDPLYFDKTIAYAVVFGLAAAWASRFQGLLAVPPTWYTPSSGNHFSSVSDLGSSLESGMQTMTSAFTSNPSSSSSGGSSGGFSGGGGGGGGGGSW